MTDMPQHPSESAPIVKHWWQSRVMWLQVATAIVAVLEAKQGLVTNLFGDWSIMVYLSAVVANVMLRFDTTTEIRKPRIVSVLENGD